MALESSQYINFESKAKSDLENKLDQLKQHPFSLKVLEQMAQDMTKDPNLKLKPSTRSNMSFCPTSNTAMIPMNFLMKNPETNRDGLVILGQLVHELKGHYVHTFKENMETIKERAEGDGIPKEVGLFLFNAMEDARINQILMDEEQQSFLIDYLYKKTWSNKSLEEFSPTGKSTVPRFEQFGYNIIYYWNCGEYLPGTSTEVVQALDRCIPEIFQIIKSEAISSSDYESREDFNQSRANHATESLVNSSIWQEYKKLTDQDKEDYQSDQQKGEGGDMDLSDQEQLPEEFKHTYDPQDIEEQEGEKGQQGHIFKFEPPLKGLERYCTSNIGHRFNPSTLQWDFSSKTKEFFGTELHHANHTCSFTLPSGARQVGIPLPRSFSIDRANLPNSITIIRNEHGVHYAANSGEKTTVELSCGPEKNSESVLDSDCLDQMYKCSLSVETEDLLQKVGTSNSSNAYKAKKLKIHISKNKRYNTKYQKKLKDNSHSADSYFQNIDAAPEFECYTANTYGVALLRKIGIPARLNCGFHPNSTKTATKITKSDGHAWAEYWDEIANCWVIVDFTPPSNEQKEEQGEQAESEMDKDAQDANEQLESDMDEISEEESKNQEDKDYKDPEDDNDSDNESSKNPEKPSEKTETPKIPDNLKLQESIYESAIKYIEPTAEKVISVLETLYSAEEKRRAMDELFRPKHKTYDLLEFGDQIGTDTQSLVNAVLSGTACWTKQIPNQTEPESVIDMFDCEFVFAVDCSGSMGGFSQTLPFAPTTALDNSFLQALTLAKVAAHFDMPFNVVLFADKNYHIEVTPEDWRNEDGNLNSHTAITKLVAAFTSTGELVGSGNSGNSNAMAESISILKESTHQKKIILLISDGDSTDGEFFDSNGESENALIDHDIYLAALGYGSATNQTETYWHRNLTFIEERFHKVPGDPSHGHMQGIPLGDFQKAEAATAQLLFDFISETGKPKLSTFKELPDYLK